MKNCDRYQEARERQENTLPLNIAANEGLFLGRLIRGGQRFTPIQRIGALVMAIPAVGIGALGIPLGITDVISESSWGMRVADSFAVVVSAVVGYLGLRVLRNVLLGK